MLTTVGDKILEIRPKQIIESDKEITSDYLVPLTTPKKKQRKTTRIKKNEELSERSSTDTSSTS
jgi:hypothetical protein